MTVGLDQRMRKQYYLIEEAGNNNHSVLFPEMRLCNFRLISLNRMNGI